ncbi:hypothetical protein QYF36_007188 [Acer negundo]|nr:hypothetical protein QYF36_007188 [Acer negundo]
MTPRFRLFFLERCLHYGNTLEFTSVGATACAPFLDCGCFALLSANWNCVLKHVYREGNRLDDALAHLGHDLRGYDNIDLKVSYRHFLNGTTSCSLQRGEKRKEIGASKLTFDGKEDLDLYLKPFRDPDLDAITDLDRYRRLRWYHSRKKCFDWEAQ